MNINPNAIIFWIIVGLLSFGWGASLQVTAIFVACAMLVSIVLTA